METVNKKQLMATLIVALVISVAFIYMINKYGFKAWL